MRPLLMIGRGPPWGFHCVTYAGYWSTGLDERVKSKFFTVGKSVLRCCLSMIIEQVSLRDTILRVLFEINLIYTIPKLYDELRKTILR